MFELGQKLLHIINLPMKEQNKHIENSNYSYYSSCHMDIF